MKYTIEVSEDELNVLISGVELWQQDPNRTDLLGAVLGATLGPRRGQEGYEEFQRETTTRAERARKEGQQRKLFALRQERGG